MNQSAFLRRFYAIVGVGACVLILLVWLFIKGSLSPRGFAVAALIYWIAMFASFFGLFRSRQRSAENERRKQIASGVPVEALDRERYIKNIRGMKKLIFVFAILLGCGLLATQGDPLPRRAEGAAIDIFFLVACLYSLLQSKRKLKKIPPNRTPSDMS